MTFSEVLDKTGNEIIELYLDYFNNFLTVGAFADYYGLDDVDAYYIIELGRKLNNDLALNSAQKRIKNRKKI